MGLTMFIEVIIRLGKDAERLADQENIYVTSCSQPFD